MSRWTLLLLSAVLMLVVAACESDDNGTDDATENGNGTEVPADDETDEETEEATPEDDETEDVTPEDDESGETESEDESEESDEAEATEPAEGTNGEDDDEVAESGDGEDAESGDEEAADPEAEGTVDPEDMQPGPEEGIFIDLDFEEANDLTDFELKEPEEVPENVEFQMIMGRAAQDASEEERSEEAATVTFAYSQPATEEAQQGLPVEFTQSIELDMLQGLPPEAEQEEISIGDREVTRVQITAETGDEIIAYVWNEDDVHFSLAAILGPDLEESELENMVASIPAS